MLPLFRLDAGVGRQRQRLHKTGFGTLKCSHQPSGQGVGNKVRPFVILFITQIFTITPSHILNHERQKPLQFSHGAIFLSLSSATIASTTSL